MSTAADMVNLLLEDKKVVLTASKEEVASLHAYMRVVKCRMDKQFKEISGGDSISEGRAIACELLSENLDGSVKVKFYLREPVRKQSKTYSFEVLDEGED
jgi:hypothetical protein